VAKTFILSPEGVPTCRESAEVTGRSHSRRKPIGPSSSRLHAQVEATKASVSEKAQFVGIRGDRCRDERFKNSSDVNSQS
jgi:hypothetical protein